jgi:hypothetical protein
MVQKIVRRHNHYLASLDGLKKLEVSTACYRSRHEPNWPDTGSWDVAFSGL